MDGISSQLFIFTTLWTSERVCVLCAWIGVLVRVGVGVLTGNCYTETEQRQLKVLRNLIRNVINVI